MIGRSRPHATEEALEELLSLRGSMHAQDMQTLDRIVAVYDRDEQLVDDDLQDFQDLKRDYL